MPSRAQASALIMAGEVWSDHDRVAKAGQLLPKDAPLFVRARQKYVSRGGIKLEGALQDTGFSPAGLTVADVGASTGGFTDCVLTQGALRVYAIDVGHGQLAEKLRQDERVIALERTNARHLTREQVGGGVDFVVVDASFIGLHKLLPALHAITRPGGHLLALIKPQFEVGREQASKNAGIIRDPILRGETIERVLAQVREHGFFVISDYPCRLPGPKGNLEHFVLAQKIDQS